MHENTRVEVEVDKLSLVSGVTAFNANFTVKI